MDHIEHSILSSLPYYILLTIEYTKHATHNVLVKTVGKTNILYYCVGVTRASVELAMNIYLTKNLNNIYMYNVLYGNIAFTLYTLGAHIMFMHLKDGYMYSCGGVVCGVYPCTRTCMRHTTTIEAGKLLTIMANEELTSSVFMDTRQCGQFSL